MIHVSLSTASTPEGQSQDTRTWLLYCFTLHLAMARSSSSAAATKAAFASLASVNPMCLSHWTSHVGLTLSVAQMCLASWGHHYSHQPRGAQTLHSSPLLLFSHIRLFVTPWTAAQQAYLSFPISLSLRKLMSIESVMPSNHLVLCCPLLLLPSIFPSIRVFSNVGSLHLVAKVLEL